MVEDGCLARGIRREAGDIEPTSEQAIVEKSARIARLIPNQNSEEIPVVGLTRKHASANPAQKNHMLCPFMLW